MGTISGSILFSGVQPTQTFLRRFTGYVEQFGDRSQLLIDIDPSQSERTSDHRQIALLHMPDEPNLRRCACASAAAVPKPAAATCRRMTRCMCPRLPADTLLDTLTVREMLGYTAELKCSHREPKAAKMARVDDLLEKLNLTVRVSLIQLFRASSAWSTSR